MHAHISSIDNTLYTYQDANSENNTEVDDDNKDVQPVI